MVTRRERQAGSRQWVVLYSAEQDAFHVETVREYADKGPGVSDYQPVDYAVSQEEAADIIKDMLWMIEDDEGTRHD